MRAGGNGPVSEFRVDTLRPISLSRVLMRILLRRPALLIPFLDPTAPTRARHVAANEAFDFSEPDGVGDYLRERRRPIELGGMDTRLTAEAADGPVLGFVIDVADRTEGPSLRRTLASLAAQADMAFSVLIRTAELLPEAIEFVGLDGRITIGAPLDQTVGLDTADFTARLMPGDELVPEAVLSLRAHLADHPRLDALYADSVAASADGTVSVQAKPDWSPTFQHGRDYVGRPCLIRSAHVRPGEPRRDAVSRIAGEGREVGHLRRILATLAPAYDIERPARRRAEERPTGASRSTHNGGASFETPAAQVPQDDELGSAQSSGRGRSAPPAPTPRATIVVPTKNRADLLGRLADTLFARTPPGSFDLVVVDNGTTDEDALALLSSLEARPGSRVLRQPGPFNFSALVNAGVEAAVTPVVVLLNNDCAITSPDWLSRLVSQAIEPGIGAVGAKLLYPDGRLQHAGVALGLGGEAGHRDRGMPGSYRGHLDRLSVPHEVATVTAACLAVRRDAFLGAGGFDEAFPVAFNDTDFCLRLRARGLRNILDPGAVLIHAESASRGKEDGVRRARFLREAALFRERWGDAIRDDPFFHPMFTLMRFRDRLG